MLKIRTKMMNVAAIAACLTVITMIVSCEKEKEKEVGVKLVDTETSGEFHMRKFFYDEQNRIKEVWRFSGGVLMEKTILTYTGEDLTKREDVYLGEDVEHVDATNYIKNGNTISWANSVNIIDEGELGNQNLNNTIILNNDGFIEKWEGNILGMSWVGDYTYVNGNPTKYSLVTEVQGSVDTREINSTYSTTYRSAFSGCNSPKWFMQLWFGGTSNVLIDSECESTEWTPYGYITTQWSVTCEYVYDRDGFPTKVTQKYSGSMAEAPDVITDYTYRN